MSDLDSMTDKEVADDLEEFRMEIYHNGIEKHKLHAHHDALMIQATKRLGSGVVFSENEIEELRRLVSRHGLSYHQRLDDYIQHPDQFKIYHKLGLFDKWFRCQAFVGEKPDADPYCTKPAVWMTNPHTDKAKKLFDNILKKAGMEGADYDSPDGAKALSEYFNETVPSIIETEFRCDDHIGKLKEIAVKVGAEHGTG